MMRISASNVAAAIGEHKYKSKEAAMQQMIDENFHYKGLLLNLKRANSLKTIDELAMEAIAKDPTLIKCVEQSLNDTFKKPQDVSQIVDTAQADIAKRLEGPFKDIIAASLAQTIQTERGTRNEANVLDLQEQDTGKSVHERNTTTVKKVQRDDTRNVSFLLVGIVDGISDNRIVDAKERKRKWTVVPSQDIIQLRAYMELYDLPEAELIERFPDGTRRNTVIHRDAEEWNRIVSKLYETAKEFQDIVENEDRLLALIEQCTV